MLGSLLVDKQQIEQEVEAWHADHCNKSAAVLFVVEQMEA